MTTNWGAGNIGNGGNFGSFGNFGNFGQAPTLSSINSNNIVSSKTNAASQKVQQTQQQQAQQSQQAQQQPVQQQTPKSQTVNITLGGTPGKTNLNNSDAATVVGNPHMNNVLLNQAGAAGANSASIIAPPGLQKVVVPTGDSSGFSQQFQQLTNSGLTPGGSNSGIGNGFLEQPHGLSLGATGVANGKGTTVEVNGSSNVELSDIDRFGLKGLLPLLKMPNTELTKVAIGADLLMAGLNLGNTSEDEKLLTTFQSPWVETSIKDVEPAYKLPQSLREFNKDKFKFLQPAENRISNYPEDTLFFIFYSKPKDILQELAARELRERNWRFHKVLKVWLAKVKEVEPIQESPLAERGVYTFFDPQIWQRVTKEFVLEYSAIL